MNLLLKEAFLLKKYLFLFFDKEKYCIFARKNIFEDGLFAVI